MNDTNSLDLFINEWQNPMLRFHKDDEIIRIQIQLLFWLSMDCALFKYVFLLITTA